MVFQHTLGAHQSAVQDCYKDFQELRMKSPQTTNRNKTKITQLHLHIKNFGKLEDAKIRIGNFTVFAGPNNTGKSFASKLLYSVFNAMCVNHAAVTLDELLEPVLHNLRDVETLLRVFRPRQLSAAAEKHSSQIYESIQDMKERVSTYAEDDVYKNEFQAFENLYPEMIKKSKEIQKSYKGLKQEIKDLEGKLRQKIKDTSASRTRRVLKETEEELQQIRESHQYLQALGSHINILHKQIETTTPQNFLHEGIGSQVIQTLKGNFQVSELSLLSSQKGKDILIDLVNNLELQISAKEISLSLKPSGLQQLRKYSRVIYLESPLYCKLKDALERLLIDPSFRPSARRRELLGVPDYFYELASLLRRKYSGDDNSLFKKDSTGKVLRRKYSGDDNRFSDLFKKLTGKKILGGKMAISDTGELVFQENNRSVPMPLTAMGVTNLALLALLIERRAIDENTFIFLDEPETHLHPAWQVVMVDTLFELSRRGVNIVMATHSADILKWIEVHVKEKPDDKELIALNHFTPQRHQRRWGRKPYGL